MLVVTMTSWVKRINNVKRVVESVMRNTVKPDRVYLNLSSTEFNGIELPKDLVDYFNSDDRLVINWVDGPNTKSMKKVFPILKYLKDDDIIITADDDILFPSDLIESRVNDFKKFGSMYSITSNKSPMGFFNGMYVASAVSLYTKSMLKNWQKYVNDDIVNTHNDDRTYLYLMWLNGCLNKPCTRHNVKELLKKYSLNLNETSMSVNKQISIGGNYDIVAEKRLKNISDKNVKNMFGFFNKENKHDCVMVYGKSGVNSQEMTCGEHLEIEYVIASLKKFCSSWVGRIFIVGSEPPEQIKNDVIHIPCDNPYTHCKDANIIHKLRYACENIPDLSEDFLMISDDQIVTRESSWEDMKPRIVRKYSDWSEQKWERNRKIGFWQECLYKTLKLFPKNTASFWEPHIWSPMNKHKFVEMCKKYDYTKSTACISQSLYYNYVGETPTRQFDHIHIPDNKVRRIVPTIGPENVERHLSWSDGAFSEKRFRDLLEYIVGFKDSFDYKTYLKNDRIMQLRKDIRLGNVVHVYTGDGKFVWKKVK